ncbi:MAG: hypothetical protein E7568_05535 [Ruminococcaceae bacterium]|nr:hypothetical protein [Oscillospiraceae bacterium]
MLKDKLFNALGSFGIIIYYIFNLFILALPFIMIDVNFILTIIFVAVEMFIPVTSIVFWIWGLVCAIIGEQDVIAIIYYIAFAILWVPYFISVIKSIFKK